MVKIPLQLTVNMEHPALHILPINTPNISVLPKNMKRTVSNLKTPLKPLSNLYLSTFSSSNITDFLHDDGYHTQANTFTKPDGTKVVRVVKRRNTANKKERRRTQSINSAYLSLRERIPNVPDDTKLSKIKTLRLARTYISYLINVLQGNQDPSVDFRPELVPSSRKINAEKRALMNNEMKVRDLRGLLIDFLYVFFFCVKSIQFY